MADVFTIDGVTLDPTTDDFVPVRFSERFGTIPSLTLQRRGIALPGLPDPWIGKEVTWTHDGTLYFVGDVVSVTPSYTGIGWVLNYQCLGFRNRLDWFPHTDNTSGIDTSQYNLTLEDPDYVPANAGRSVGQILTDVLTMTLNANNCDACGMGGYTTLSPPTLPAATLADLAVLTMIVPRPVYFSGEKFGSAIDGFLQTWAPNHRFWVQPDGVFRFLDLRTFTPQTLTMGSVPIEPTELSRDVGDCFQRVEVRGQPIAIMGVLKESLGQLDQNFAHDGLNNADAIADWDPSQFRSPGTAQDVGTCSCPSTITVTVTSDDPTAFWSADFWDQTHQQGAINLYSTTTLGVTQLWSARIVNCPALTAGGSCTLTIDNPLPHTDFDNYTITGLSTGGSVVWTQYQIADSDLWDKVVKQSTFPQPFVSPGGGGVSRISTPFGVVLWSSSGSPPYNSFPLAFTYNPTTGNIRFLTPTYFIANNAPPADVWVALPLMTNPNYAIQPPDSGGPVYSGTSYTIDGLTKTLVVDAPYWRDPGQLSQVQAYAESLLDSVHDATIEGAVVYYGFFDDAMTFGLALNIDGDDGDGPYTTGWESAALPVIGVDVEWPQTEGMDYRTTMHCSNRRQALSSQAFMAPERQLDGYSVFGDYFNPFGVYQPDTSGYSEGNYREMAAAALSGSLGAGPMVGGQSGFDDGFSFEDVMAAGAPIPRDTTPRRPKERPKAVSPSDVKGDKEQELEAYNQRKLETQQKDEARQAEQKARIEQTNEANRQKKKETDERIERRRVADIQAKRAEAERAQKERDAIDERNGDRERERGASNNDEFTD